MLAGDASSTGLPLSLAGEPPAAHPPVAGLLASVAGQRHPGRRPGGRQGRGGDDGQLRRDRRQRRHRDRQLDVTIEPPPSKAHPDQAPVPEEVDTRETAGDVAVIQIPVYGVDPDGDSVTVTGVTTPPALGRIVAVGPHSISYQSYPDSAGTDTFTYQVTDPYGLTGTATVRVAVLPPGPPQPPVAVTDVLNAPPGASLHWDVLGNDYIAPGDTVTVEPLSKTNTTVPAGVQLDGVLRLPEGAVAPSDPPVEFTYGDTDGSTPSLAQVIVHPVPGAKVPPIANDVVAPPPPAGAATVTVNVLKNDDDPLGSPSDLKISWAPAGVSVHGASLTIRLTAQPREVPYQVTAPDGLTATAVVYVPGTPASAIRLRPGARITLRQNGSVTVPLSSMLMDTSGRQLKITTADQLSASPAGSLAVSANQDDRLPGARARRLYRPGRGHRPGLRRRDDAGPARQHRHADDPGPGRARRADPALPAGPGPGRRGRRAGVATTSASSATSGSTPPCRAGAAALQHGVGQGRGRGQRQRARRHRLQLTAGEQRGARHHGDAADHPGGRHRVRHAQRRGHRGAAAVGARGRRLGRRRPQRHGRPQPVRHQPAGRSRTSRC